MLLDFNNDIILEDNRVILSPLRKEHFADLLEYSLNEPELWTYSLFSADGKKNLERYIEFALAERKNNRAYPFVVFDKKKNKLAGSTRFYDFQAMHNTTQLGYTWYGKEFQGTGLNKHCKYLMLEYAFEIIALDRVEFRADKNNIRSIYAMKSIGCYEEGVLRSNCSSPSGRRDSIVLSILKSEWNEIVKQHLMKKIQITNLNEA